MATLILNPLNCVRERLERGGKGEKRGERKGDDGSKRKGGKWEEEQREGGKREDEARVRMPGGDRGGLWKGTPGTTPQPQC